MPIKCKTFVLNLAKHYFVDKMLFLAFPDRAHEAPRRETYFCTHFKTMLLALILVKADEENLITSFV